jgi:restriction endonuclease S subunit
MNRNGWQVKTLGEVVDVIAGQSPPSSTYNYIQDGLPFFQGKVDFGTTFPKVRVWCNEPVKIGKPIDILISVRAPVGPTNICDVESCIGRGLSSIRSNENSCSSFFAPTTICRDSKQNRSIKRKTKTIRARVRKSFSELNAKSV